MTRFEVLPHFLDMIPIRGLNASPHSTADDTSMDDDPTPVEREYWDDMDEDE